MDFQLSPIFVNLSLLVLSLTTGKAAPTDERAILADAEPLAGRLEIDPMTGVVFRSSDGDTVLPARNLRKVVQTSPPFIAPGTSPAHRVHVWGNESLSGTVQSLDGNTVQLRTPPGDLVRVPLYLISKIDHFQGEAVVFRDDFENDQPARHVAGDVEKSSEQAASGRWSLRMVKPGDSLEYRLPDPIGNGWFEARFFDSGQMQAGLEWVCEFEFTSSFGTRTLQVYLGWGAESYGLTTPQGPSLPVQRLARRQGWSRLGLRFAPDRTTVLIDDAVLTHGEAGRGQLRAIRFLIRKANDADVAQEDNQPAGFVDDVQIAASIGLSVERQPTVNQDDVLLTNGDQVFGQIKSATSQALTVHGEFGDYSVPWSKLQEIHFGSRPCPNKLIEGQRVRVRFAATPAPRSRGSDTDLLEGVLRELTDETMVVDHPHIGPIRILRGQLRDMEFLAGARWLAIDSRYHHFGDQVNLRFQVPHPEGSNRSWEFSLDQVPPKATLVLHAIGMEAMAPGGEFNKRLENDEWRTYVEINGQKIDNLGLNHLLPLNARGAVRLVVPVAPELLKNGKNVLRLFQTPEKDDPGSFDDCGIFGIGLEMERELKGKE